MSRRTHLNLEQKLLAIWYKDAQHGYQPNLLLKAFLSILSKIYFIVLKSRNILFKLNIFKSYTASVPIIIIGNITTGGTGKTSFVIALADYLVKLGLKPGIVTRGYQAKRQSQIDHVVLLTSESNQGLGCEITGDEARLLHNSTGLPVAICKDRVAAVKSLVANGLCNIILSDDGLQHYKLNRDMEICLVDAIRMFGNNKLIPAGPLRETTRRLNNVDFLLLKDHGFKIIPTSFINLATNANIPFEGFSSQLNNTAIHAYAGLGNNNNFFSLLTNVLQKSCDLITNIDKHHFPDHYSYQQEDFLLLDNNQAVKLDKRHIIITTEKDAVKIKDLLKDSAKLADIYYLKIMTQLHGDFLFNFELKLQQLLEKYSIDYKPHPYTKEVDYVR